MPDGPGPPLVTVIVNCFNHARFLEECLESVRAQTYPHVQLIVMDDCSTDGSAELIRGWLRRTATPATLVVNPHNRGLPATRNHGLDLAQGAYVASVSTDDVWLPTKIEVQVARLEELGTGVGVLYGDANCIDEDGTLLPGTCLSRWLEAGEAPPEGDVFNRIAIRNFIPPMAAMTRLSDISAIGGYDRAVPLEDWDLFVRLARRTRFAYLPEVTASYRIVATSRIHTMTVAGCALTEFLVARKHLGYRHECNAALRASMAHAALYLQEVRHPGSERFLWEAMRSAPLALLSDWVSRRRAKSETASGP